MMRFDWRATGFIPACARPWPLEFGKPSMGERPMRKLSRMPSLTATTGLARTPLIVEVVGADQIPLLRNA